MGMGKTLSFMLFMMLPSSSGAKKGSVSGSCSAIVSEECRKGVCEVVTWTSVMNAVVAAVVDKYPDNMSVYHSDCMCNSGWCVGSVYQLDHRCNNMLLYLWLDHSPLTAGNNIH